MHVYLVCLGIATLSAGSVYVQQLLPLCVFTAMHPAVYAATGHMLQANICRTL